MRCSSRLLKLTAAVLGLFFCLAWLPGMAGAEPGTLVYSWPSNVGPLNPHLYSPSQMFAQAMVYEPLVKYGPGGKIIPCLAESWDVSPDGREYVFHLRKGVVFSDGTPFNAAAVKMNNDTVVANAQRHSWLEMVNQIKETVVVDEHTVRMLLKEPYYPLLQDLALVRPLRYLSPSGFPADGDTAKGMKAPIGTGPWVLKDIKLGEYDVFVRNEKYWGPKPKIEKIVVKVIPDPNTRAVAFETCELDLIYGDGQISLDTFNRFRNDKRYTTLVSQPLSTRTVAMNSNRGFTRELAVRRAIEHSVNKEAIIKGVFLDTEIKADTLYPKNIPYCGIDLLPFAYDQAEAGRILDEAGWKLAGGEKFRTRNGEILAVDLCFVGNDAVQKSVAEVLQADLGKVGIKANLLGEEKDSYYKRQKAGEFDLIFNDTWGPPYDPHSYSSSMRTPSHADYQAQSGLPMKAEIDGMISRVLITVDEAERRELYRKILTTLHEQAVYLPISYTTGLVVHRADLSNVVYGQTKSEIPFEDMVKQ